VPWRLGVTGTLAARWWGSLARFLLRDGAPSRAATEIDRKSEDITRIYAQIAYLRDS
jgi:hypothetical protein